LADNLSNCTPLGTLAATAMLHGDATPFPTSIVTTAIEGVTGRLGDIARSVAREAYRQIARRRSFGDWGVTQAPIS
jgi:hypothetical protein